MNFILGKKIEMSQIFSEDGKVIPVTILDISENMIVGTKTDEKDGYTSLVIGKGKKKNAKKSEVGKFKKLGYVPEFISEYRVDSVDDVKIGDTVKLEKGNNQYADVTGISKGKGFQGVVRKFNFAGGPKTHGQSDRHRAPGSIGSGTTPGRVYKGKKMPGHLGDDKTTMKNLKIVDILTDDNLLLVKGSVPGKRGSFLKINIHTRD